MLKNIKMVNKYELPRTIPELVKRLVRQNSGFGCVICGTAICEYEHVDPEWHEAKEHNAEQITLLCGSCHSKKTRGIYSTEKVKEAMRSPKCKSNGFTFDYLDFGILPKVYFGRTLFYSQKSIISIDGNDILSLTQPSQPNEPYTLNAIFHNYDEKPILTIENNIWYGKLDNWDIQCVGTRISIRQKKGNFVLILNNIPRERLVVERIKMKFKQYEIVGDMNSILVRTPRKEKLIEINFGGEIFGDTGLKIENEKVLIEHSTIKNAELTFRNTIATDTIFDNCGISIIGSDGGLFRNCYFGISKSISIVQEKSPAGPNYNVKDFFKNKMQFDNCIFNYLGTGKLNAMVIISDP